MIITRGGVTADFKSLLMSRCAAVRGRGHLWDPRQQRPELWRLYNTRLGGRVLIEERAAD